jgi:hypothetical protein
LSKNKIGGLFLVGLLTGLAIMGGFILLIIPGIIFLVWFALSSYVYVYEGIGGTEALKRSKYYVSGRWGAVFWRFFFLFIISVVISIVIGIITGPFNSGDNKAVGQSIQNLVSFVWSPLAAAYGVALYNSLKKS